MAGASKCSSVCRRLNPLVREQPSGTAVGSSRAHGRGTGPRKGIFEVQLFVPIVQSAATRIVNVSRVDTDESALTARLRSIHGGMAVKPNAEAVPKQ
jgi:hypothetical protein